MPTYEYSCEKCDKKYEVIKSIKEYDGRDQCPDCGNIGNRIFSCNIQFIGTKIEDAEYNPGLGQITYGKQDREEKAKRLGVMEIGNDFKTPDEIHKTNDKALAEKRKKAWDSV